MLALEQVEPAAAPPIESFSDCTVFQTDEWLNFVEETQGAQRVVAVVRDGNTVVGRFTGLIVKRLGVRLLGSPSPGWTTAYMGFNLQPDVSRVEALTALNRFAFKDLGCIHYEVMDRSITAEQVDELGYRYRPLAGFEIDLTRSEDELFATMHRNIRYETRRAKRAGVTIEEAVDDGFAEDYYTQLIEVFKRQGLKPTYDISRVRSLIRHLLPVGRLLLLRARESEGSCASTLLALGFNGQAYFWGASSRRHLKVPHRNESLLWYAMRYWKTRGMTVFDMGGGGEYKRRYGGKAIIVPWIRKSRYPGMDLIREGMRRYSIFRQRRGADSASPPKQTKPSDG
ncbi:MAG: GNAT family N-acetyltransferase [Actinobacteria bacterium]|nr:GNAT family N-acetyltransferase [Actinomycetota bacterium]